VLSVSVGTILRSRFLLCMLFPQIRSLLRQAAGTGGARNPAL